MKQSRLEPVPNPDPRETPSGASDDARAKPQGGKRATKHGQQNNCTHHCVACSGHFTSLSAFDAHRRGDPDHRYCDPEATTKDGVPLLVVKSEQGTCHLSYPSVVGAAVVWAMRGWEQAAERFREEAA